MANGKSKRKRSAVAESESAGSGGTTTTETKRTKKPATQTERRVTRAMTLDAARSAVLNTTELLEAILVHLEVQSIVLSRRVSRHFHDAIDRSVQINLRLFYRTYDKQQYCKINTDAHGGKSLTRGTDTPDFTNGAISIAARGVFSIAALNSLFTTDKEAWSMTMTYSGATIHPGPTMLSALSLLVNGNSIPNIESMALCDPTPARIEVKLCWAVGQFRGEATQTFRDVKTIKDISIPTMLATTQIDFLNEGEEDIGAGLTFGELVNQLKQQTGKEMELVEGTRIKLLGIVILSEEDKEEEGLV